MLAPPSLMVSVAAAPQLVQPNTSTLVSVPQWTARSTPVAWPRVWSSSTGEDGLGFNANLTFKAPLDAKVGHYTSVYTLTLTAN